MNDIHNLINEVDSLRIKHQNSPRSDKEFIEYGISCAVKAGRIQGMLDVISRLQNEIYFTRGMTGDEVINFINEIQHYARSLSDNTRKDTI